MTAPRPPIGPVSGARTAEEMREEGLLPVEPGCRRAMPVAEVAPGIDLAAIGARAALVVTEAAHGGARQAWTSSYMASAADVPALLAAVREGEAREGGRLGVLDGIIARQMARAEKAEVREVRLRTQMAEARRWLENTGDDASSCFIGHAIGKALAALSHEAPASPEPTPEEMARLDAGQTTTMRTLRAGALTEAQARAEKAEAENKRMRAELAGYRAADRERKDIL